jgi:uncharacterized membrane protein YfcA
MDLAAALLLVAAATAGGAMNAVAGGGSFLTFPSLLFAGVPAIPANATSAVALWPGSLASAWGYREDLAHEKRVLRWFGAVSLAGGLAGALLLLLTPERTFRALIPWLLLGATAIFAFGPILARRLREAGSLSHRVTTRSLLWLSIVQLLVAVYGGYFGGGIGILMLAAFAAMGMEDIHAMNGLKAVLALLINGIAVVAFIVAGVVDWPAALLMVAGAVLGGYLGARGAKKVDAKWLRVFVIVVGLTLTAYFFLDP